MAKEIFCDNAKARATCPEIFKERHSPPPRGNAFHLARERGEHQNRGIVSVEARRAIISTQSNPNKPKISRSREFWQTKTAAL